MDGWLAFTITPQTAALLAIAASLLVLQFFRSNNPYGSNTANTPYVRPWLPIVGSIGYALRPQLWMEKMHKQMGDVFTTKILGHYVTFVRGHANVVRWAGAANKELSMLDAYKTIAGSFLGPEVFTGVTKTLYDGLVPSRLDRIQDDLFALAQHFFLSKLGSSTSWSNPIDLTPLLMEGTFVLAAWALCGRQLSEKHGTELAALFHTLENDLSILGIVLNFPTPAVRRREKAKQRAFEIIQHEFNERVKAMLAGKEVEDDFMSVALGDMVDEELLHSDDEQKKEAAIRKVVFVIYGMIWGAHSNTSFSAIAAFCDLLENPSYIDSILSQANLNSHSSSPSFIFSQQTYLLRCLTETFRRRSLGTLLRLAPSPFTISHPQSSSNSGDTIIAPPGFVVVAPSHISLSPTTYPSPLKFNPARYDPSIFPHELDTVQSPSVSSTAGLFAAWGMGKHACPGRFLAYRIIGNLVLAMFAEWEVEMVGKGPGWTSLGVGGVDRADGAVMVRWRKRTLNATA